VIRVPAVEPEEDMVLRLLEEHDVLVHPGYFFDFPSEAWIVLSLLPEPHTFELGIERLREGLGEKVNFTLRKGTS
jgi:aspartate/methionine/tyrosine aminotransferase